MLPQLFDKKEQSAENQRRLLLYPVNQGVRLGAIGAVIFGCLHCIPGVYFCMGGAFGIIILEMILAFWVILHSPNNFDGADAVKKGAEKESVDLNKGIVDRRDRRSRKTNALLQKELFSIIIEPSPQTKDRVTDFLWFVGCNFILMMAGKNTDRHGVTDMPSLRSIPIKSVSEFSLN